MAYSLKDDGDLIEQRYWPELHEHFPNYEVLWQEIVTPLSRRGYDGNLQLREGIHPLLEHLCMTHHSLYQHLGGCLEDELETDDVTKVIIRFDNGLYHLGIAVAMVEDFLLVIRAISETINGKSSTVLLAPVKLQNKLNKFTYEKYKAKVAQLYQSGFPVSVPLHGVNDAVLHWIKTQRPELLIDYKAWMIVAQSIRSYRNRPTHYPRMGYVIKSDGQVHVPRASALEQYANWSNVVYGSPKPDELIRPKDLIQDFLHQLIVATNKLWEPIIGILKELSGKPAYRSMSKLDGAAPIEQSSSVEYPGTLRVKPDSQPLLSGTYAGWDFDGRSYPPASGIRYEPPEFPKLEQ